MHWTDYLHGDSLRWLLEHPQPGVRYLALRDLLDRPADDAELAAARGEAYQHGPIAEVLAAMQPEGYWAAPGPGYNPKYRASVWALILLAQLGASARQDARIATGCAYLLDHALTPGGQFSMNGAPSGTIDCLQGNLCWALTVLEYEDARLESAFDWMACSITGEGIAPKTERHADRRYYASQCGPLFACGANLEASCAWGAVKAMLAFGALSPARRTPQIERAIQSGLNFLLDNHPAQAGYPSSMTGKPSSSWWKFGFPVFYITDVLQIIEAVVGLGCGRDERLAEAFQLALDKQDDLGRWALDYTYHGKTYGDFGEKRAPNPWVTLRVLRAIKSCDEA